MMENQQPRDIVDRGIDVPFWIAIPAFCLLMAWAALIG
jgi:hypothetical protein